MKDLKKNFVELLKSKYRCNFIYVYFFGNVMLVLIVYLFINKNLFYGIFMLEKDMFWVYWKKRCFSILVLFKSIINVLMWWDYFVFLVRVKFFKGWFVIKL